MCLTTYTLKAVYAYGSKGHRKNKQWDSQWSDIFLFEGHFEYASKQMYNIILSLIFIIMLKIVENHLKYIWLRIECATKEIKMSKTFLCL